MQDLRKALDLVLEGKVNEAGDILFEQTTAILADKIEEARKMVAAESFPYESLTEGVVEYPRARDHVADVHANGELVGHISKHYTSDGRESHYTLHSHSPHTGWAQSHHNTFGSAKHRATHLINIHARAEGEAWDHKERAGVGMAEAVMAEEADYKIAGPHPEGGYSVFHKKHGMIGTTETMPMRHKNYSSSGSQVIAHHDLGQTFHTTHERAVRHIISQHKEHGGVFAEGHEPSKNVQRQGRTKIVKVRVRGGKVQRRKKLSAVPGFIQRDGKVVRMSAAERRHRKMGARKGKLKRRAHKSQIHRKLLQSLRKRKNMGL